MTTETQQKSIELMQQKAVSMANALPDNQTTDPEAVYGKALNEITEEQTTEDRLSFIRISMKFYIPRQTFGREHGRIQGYYYTEPVDVGRV